MSDEVREESAVDAIAAAASGAFLLDVREGFEWDEGHAPTAHHLPMGELQARADELPQDREIHVVCHSGGRSYRVTEALVAAGYDAVNVAGGMLAWRAEGGPVIVGGQTTPERA
jgi:rhodanese-related sulfurtransferase